MLLNPRKRLKTQGFKQVNNSFPLVQSHPLLRASRELAREKSNVLGFSPTSCMAAVAVIAPAPHKAQKYILFFVFRKFSTTENRPSELHPAGDRIERLKLFFAPHVSVHGGKTQNPLSGGIRLSKPNWE